MADYIVLKDLVHHLFVCDDASFAHDRIPIQTLCTLLMCYTGSDQVRSQSQITIEAQMMGSSTAMLGPSS